MRYIDSNGVVQENGTMPYFRRQGKDFIWSEREGAYLYANGLTWASPIPLGDNIKLPDAYSDPWNNGIWNTQFTDYQPRNQSYGNSPGGQQYYFRIFNVIP